MKKQIGAYILLPIALCLIVFPALAQPVSKVVVGSYTLNNNDCYAYVDESGYVCLGGDEGNYHFKFDDGVLTVRNAVTKSSVCIEEIGDLLINLVGDNQVYMVDNNKSGELTFGGSGNIQMTQIESSGALTFSGTGKIEVGYLDAENKQHASTTAIFCNDQITVNSGTISAMASNSWVIISPSPGGTMLSDPSYAIWGKKDMVVNGGKVIARSGETPTLADSFAIGLFGYVGSGKRYNTLTIKDGEVDAIAKRSSGGNSNNSWINSASSVGVAANVILEGGSLTAKSRGVGSYGTSAGVLSKVTQSGGKFVAEGGPISSYSVSGNYESSYGCSEIEFTGGSTLLSGVKYAVRKATIADGTEVTCSTKKDGSVPSEFNAEDITKYRYLQLELNMNEHIDTSNMPETGDSDLLKFMVMLFAGAMIGLCLLKKEKVGRYQ